MGKFLLAIATVLARRWILGIASGVLVAGAVTFIWVPRHVPAKVVKPQGVWASIDNSGYLLRLSGSKTMGSGLAPELVTAWLVSIGASDVEESHPVGPDGETISGSLIRARLKGNPIVVEVKAHSSAAAFTDMANGVADIGITSREINPSEVTELMPFGDMRSAASEHVIGREGIAVIVPRSNTISSISLSTLKKIFSGEITNWAAVGAKSLPIHIYTRDNNSGSYKTFASLVLGDVPMAAAKRYEDSEMLESNVASDPGAIGFVTMAYVKDTRVVSINGVTAAALERRLYLYTAAVSENPAAADFVRFAISPEGQNVVRKGPFVADLGDSGLSNNPVVNAPRRGENVKVPATGENAQPNAPAPPPPIGPPPPPMAGTAPEVSTQLNKVMASLQAPPPPDPQAPSPVAPPPSPTPNLPAPQPIVSVVPPGPPTSSPPAPQPVVKVSPQEAPATLTPPVATTSHAVTAIDYPPASMRMQEEGKVLITYLVKEDGSVGGCNVTTSSGKSLLDDAACAMVRRHWRFKPAMQNGKPVAKFLTAEVIFKLY